MSPELQKLSAYLKAWEQGAPNTLVPLLPLLFTLKGKPYDVTQGHFPMRPMFEIGPKAPRRSLWKTGRQLGKSTVQAHHGVATAMAIPYFDTLFITPLYEQIRRFSTNYVKPVMRNCVLRDTIIEGSGKAPENVLQKTMPHNQSTLHFSFAYQDVERVRGLAVSCVAVDEVQGINREFLPVIIETMSASDWGIERYTGTPLSKANIMEYLWQDSSQGEWAIKCQGCKHTSVLGAQFDLLKCIGLQGLVCSKCDKPINTEEGYWLHGRPERRLSFVGRHAPQCIFPMHCRNQRKWGMLLEKRQKNFPKFMMECMGESTDVGTHLVSKGDLQAACTLPWANTWEDYIKNYNQRGYQMRVLAVDWSGGGADEVSLTAMAAIGLRMDGKIEVGWMKHYPHSTNWMDDAKRVMAAFHQGAFNYLVSDAGGAGDGRQNFLMQAGFPAQRLFPVSYVHTTGDKALMTYNSPQASNVRRSCSLDKARSLILSCELIRQGVMQFPAYSTCQDHLEDFLALVEETMQTPRGSDIHLISKAPGVPDDMAHAVNMGTCSIYYLVQKWPDLGEVLRKNDKMTLGELNLDTGASRSVDAVE